MPASQTDGAIEIIGLRKSFGGVGVLKGVDLRADQGEFISVVGPSGCGKTTTLNIVAGFEQADGGDLRIGGQSMLTVPSHRRGLGMVFQNHALFPHMTILDNVGFGLAMRGVPREDARRRAGTALDLVRLSGLSGRYPRELSGGQQQRVGIARALTVEPRVILMDEPLSSLDAKLRREMQIELRRIQKEVGITALYVTHDQEEALTMSDRIVLMNKGRIEQDGRPEELYSRPNSEFVAGFIGEATFFDARVASVDSGEMSLDIAGLGASRAPCAPTVERGAPVRLAVRPDRVRLHAADGVAGFAGRVASRAFTGPGLRYVIETEAGPLLAETGNDGFDQPTLGATVGWSVAPADWIVLPSRPEAA
jgi:putative spermidine/putrescine transport system ATP-binding protein